MGESTLRRLTSDDWTVLSDVRLRALADSPDAFGSTLEREQTFGEKEWRRRLVRPVWIVEADGRGVAMAGAFSNEGVLQVWGMWTDPAHRGRGHARALLDALVGEAVREGRVVGLHVNLANPGARAFYESYGFVGTGELEPLRPGSDQRIELMLINPKPVG
ncbi:GNAT family N-acetyltransferase [Nocardioides agariphilus]|jgi:predicted GNAT family acetyltransferase|uniref:GNAT family N-acetyltransferase n=1 Tax=Nocardioides agariphilus TaxID=433664 RepID=A0A930VUC5_9ACTN|nr:GNAT family N-acetyltransferase [Nocardioides agariphilus]MBF4770050.1 GNAT family N-acetyltransferase [Nocardioides agariphilus]